MEKRLSTRVGLGVLALLCSQCGGATETGGTQNGVTGTGGVAGNAAAGSSATGGSALGGSSTGGTAAGGAAAGGTAAGGASSGGAGNAVCSGPGPGEHVCPATCSGDGGACTPDQCLTMADCGAKKACICGSATPSPITGKNQPNYCVQGNCNTDADCAGSCCRESVPTFCGMVSTGVYGFYCRTPQDECASDADCTGVIAKCGYAPEVGHWKCVAAQACG